MPTIAITMGDPQGIGPELIAKVFNEASKMSASKLLIYGDEVIMKKAFAFFGEPFPKHSFVQATSAIVSGCSSEEISAALTANSLIAATTDALAGKLSAIVTAPVNKARLKLAIPNFQGHTEFFMEKCNRSGTMIFYVQRKNDPLFISLVTTHAPIKILPSLITTEAVFNTIRATHAILSKFSGRKDLKIAVTGLNPHAGENGTIGTEEISEIIPAIKLARKEGINVDGPFSADGIFFSNVLDTYAAVVTMFHDQAMIPAKLLSAGSCVNITWGLPFVRTSPGHGTAENIAGKGISEKGSMLQAIQIAEKLLIN